MKPAILFLALTLTACASSGPREYPGVRLKPAANPSAVIAAELAFAQLAQTKGQWTAFRETATKGAEMFVPQRVNAQGWLKGKADPATAVKWQPHGVWSSCDGSFAVTRGAWQSANASGGFVTVWQRQGDQREPGPYKWVLDMSVTTEQGYVMPEMIAARVADCAGDRTAAVRMFSPNRTRDESYRNSTDNTLQWYSAVEQNGKREFIAQMWNGKEFSTVVNTGVDHHKP